MIGIETCPAGIGRRTRADIVGRLATDVNVEPAHLEPVVAEAGFAQPSQPCLDEGCERGAARRLPVWAECQRGAHRQRTFLMGLFVGAQQLRRRTMPLEQASGPEGMIGADRKSVV